MKTMLKTIGGVIVAGLIFAVVFSYSGAFNVAADWEDPTLLRWLLVTTRVNSIESRAGGIEVPPLTEVKNIESGFRSYREMCAMCHTPPGRKDSPFTAGMNPPPPDLAKSAEQMSAAELFWATKNGIRMTGMPAWGKTHKDPELWDIIAFVKTMPKMNKEQYDAMDRRLPPGHDHSGGGHGDDHHGSAPASDHHSNADGHHDNSDGHHDNLDGHHDNSDGHHDNSDGHHATEAKPASDGHHDDGHHDDGHKH